MANIIGCAINPNTPECKALEASFGPRTPGKSIGQVGFEHIGKSIVGQGCWFGLPSFGLGHWGCWIVPSIIILIILVVALKIT